MYGRYADFTETVELLLHARKALLAKGYRFRIIHQFRAPGSDCAAGEEVAAALLLVWGKEYAISMSGVMLLLFDYLARHSRLPLTAKQIVLGMKSDPFCQEHGANISARARLATTVNPSGFRVYVQRIRAALTKAFSKAGISIDPFRILVAERTFSNRLAYQLKGTFEWLHTDHPGREFECIG